MIEGQMYIWYNEKPIVKKKGLDGWYMCMRYSVSDCLDDYWSTIYDMIRKNHE